MAELGEKRALAIQSLVTISGETPFGEGYSGPVNEGQGHLISSSRVIREHSPTPAGTAATR